MHITICPGKCKHNYYCVKFYAINHNFLDCLQIQLMRFYVSTFASPDNLGSLPGYMRVHCTLNLNMYSKAWLWSLKSMTVAFLTVLT